MSSGASVRIDTPVQIILHCCTNNSVDSSLRHVDQSSSQATGAAAGATLSIRTSVSKESHSQNVFQFPIDTAGRQSSSRCSAAAAQSIDMAGHSPFVLRPSVSQQLSAANNFNLSSSRPAPMIPRIQLNSSTGSRCSAGGGSGRKLTADSLGVHPSFAVSVNFDPSCPPPARRGSSNSSRPSVSSAVRPPPFNPQYLSDITNYHLSTRSSAGSYHLISPASSHSKSPLPCPPPSLDSSCISGHVVRASAPPTSDESRDMEEEFDDNDDVFYEDSPLSRGGCGDVSGSSVECSGKKRKWSQLSVTDEPEGRTLSVPGLQAATPGACAGPRRLSGELAASPVIRRLVRFSVINDKENNQASTTSPHQLAASSTNTVTCVSRVAICPVTGDMLLVDCLHSAVHVYSNTGRLLSSVGVSGVTGGCFLTECRLALSTQRGVEIYYKAGFILIYEDRGLSIGPVLNTLPFNNAFIAVQSYRLSMYQMTSTSFEQLHSVTSYRRSSSLFHRSTKSLHDVIDAAVLRCRDIVVLHPQRLSVVDLHGHLKANISPASDPCGPLSDPSSLAVDCRGNIVVCDAGNRRLIQFGGPATSYRYKRLVLDMNQAEHDGKSPKPIFPQGMQGCGDRPLAVAVDGNFNRLAVLVHRADDDCGEIRIYQL